MAFHSDADIDPKSNPFIRLIQRFIPVTNRFHGNHFFVNSAAIVAEFDLP